MVMRAIEKGYQIAIATNPLFPPLAILHRLDWAGLSAKEFNYSLVPSYETFHFAKPNPAYYAELLAQMGWPEGPVVMVGNDPIRDIQGAQELGLATFWITREEEAEHCYVMDGNPMTASGWLDKVLPWIEKAGAEQLMPQFEMTTAITAILKSTPAATSTLLKEIPVDDWKTRPSEDQWSLCEILCHLRDVDLEINIPRIKTILAEDNPFIEAIDSDVWAVEREYQKQDAVEALEDFVQARIELLDIISELGEEAWQKTARHSIFGPTTTKELLKITSRHDRLHMQQIYGNCQALRN
jgi:hypothetical protein